MKKIFLFLLLASIFSCKNDNVLPKPQGYLSLTFAKKNYRKLEIKRPYLFDIAKNSVVIDKANSWLKVEYPQLKASIDITYRPVKNNLRELLMEAEKLVFEHTIKAENITSKDFENIEQRVFGSLYDITGNSASHVQFHVTDSSKHFLKGSLFFKVKPNYDSILPAVDYIKKDMIRMIESLEWKE